MRPVREIVIAVQTGTDGANKDEVIREDRREVARFVVAWIRRPNLSPTTIANKTFALKGYTDAEIDEMLEPKEAKEDGKQV